MGVFKKLFNFISPAKRQQAKNIERRLGEIKEVRELSAGKSHRDPMAEQVKRRAEKANLNRRLGKIQAEAEENARVRQVNDRLKNVRKEREKLERQRSNPALRFMEGERVSDFRSSCVKEFWYDAQKGLLFISFKDNTTYRYGIAGGQIINGEMAMSLFRAASKGTWVWDNLRIRGTKLGHRVPYAIIAGGEGVRKYLVSDPTLRAHLEKARGESPGFKNLFNFAKPKRPKQHLGKERKPGDNGPFVKQGGKEYNVNRDSSGRGPYEYLT